MPIYLVGDWRMIAVRGVASIAFGVMALAWPGLTVTVLVLLFGAFVLLDGIAGLALAVSFPVQARHRRKAFLAEGVAGVLVGAITLAWPGITGLVLLWIIALWALVTGALEIAAAVRLRRALRGDWFLAVVGVLSVLFGSFLLITPGEGALVITWVIGWYAVLFGILLLVFAGRVKSRGVARSRRPSDTESDTETA